MLFHNPQNTHDTAHKGGETNILGLIIQQKDILSLICGRHWRENWTLVLIICKFNA